MDSECPNFPGRWVTKDAAYATALDTKVFQVCECAGCLASWPRPNVKTGDTIEVAGKFGIFVAIVTGSYRSIDDMLCLEITSAGSMVSREWDYLTIDRYNSMWRMYDPERLWARESTGTRYDREDVL